MFSKAGAKAAVLAIAKGYGLIGDDIMDQIQQWNPEIRHVIEESMLAKDKLSTDALKTLAKNISDNDAPFIFELLQNADDNSFTQALADRALPYISFQVHSSRIIIECNEDGFTRDDLSAICSVGKSTKPASHHYIGGKGIGFKSVFSAAWKVYIQSGNLSFYFKHEPGDAGLGMVLPVWEDTNEKLPDPLTRMTLYLHKNEKQNKVEHLLTYFKQLIEFPHYLMFLRNLRQIRVAIYDENGRLQSSGNSSIRNVDKHRIFLETLYTNSDGENAVEKKYYHVTRHTPATLLMSNNRELPDSGERRWTYSRTEIVLAFPLTSAFKPMTEKQELFAFLPIRESDYKFIIQADFDTSADRRDILPTSSRNRNNLDEILVAFRKAVLEFCEHTTLCYTWPMFLPDLNDNAGVFWSGLNQQIQRLMSATPILRSRHTRNLHTIDQVVLVADTLKDASGEPLLDDSRSDPFLSKLYPQACRDILMQKSRIKDEVKFYKW
ncbi:ATPase-like, ATP-binding domain [Pleurostoma richardsiae]|uniref:ATPase-like, ATP-binding domain n=1 Tax=Pleurostoma richardsiae TaxID=41990 RepID=A0AA38RYT7_9PEZI|nr:ATPase-like, ATP-binding domain [Pleurostoma richardsiae]